MIQLPLKLGQIVYSTASITAFEREGIDSAVSTLVAVQENAVVHSLPYKAEDYQKAIVFPVREDNHYFHTKREALMAAVAEGEQYQKSISDAIIAARRYLSETE